MKKLAAICLLIVSLNARADLAVVETMSGGGQSGSITMKIKGDKARIDMGTQISSIIDIKTGDMTTLIHGQKMFVQISGEKSKALMEAMKKAKGETAPPEAPKVVDTGRKEKVGDYNTEVYTGEIQGMKFTFWVTKDIPDFAAVQAQMKKLESLRDKTGQPAPDTSKIEGVPVKTETEFPSGQVATTILVSLKTDPIDDAEFVAPADYKEMQMPNMNGAGAPAGGADAPPPPPPQQ